MRLAAIALGLIVVAGPVSALDDSDIFTLYRNSVLDGAIRIHVATFDTEDGREYNANNCAVAADLFQRQDGVKARFWGVIPPESKGLHK